MKVRKALITALLALTAATSSLALSSCSVLEKIPGVGGLLEKIPGFGHKHELTLVEGEDATCEKTGKKDYYTCDGCDKLFADAEGKKEISAPEVIQALGHTEETVEGYAATCLDKGLTDGVKCSVCGETLTAQEEIPALGHTEEVVAGKAPTSATTGLTDGKKCSVCGETLVAQEEIPMHIIDVNAVGTYVMEAEYLDQTNLVPSVGEPSVKVESPSGNGPATSGGQSLGCVGSGSSTSFTIKLQDKATVKIFGVLAQADGGNASDFMSAKLNETELVVSGTLPVGTGKMPYWNWAECPFGTAMDLEAGEYVLTLTFLKNPNADCFKVVALSYGEYAPSGDTAYITDEAASYRIEAEDLSLETLVGDSQGVTVEVRPHVTGVGHIAAGGYQTFKVKSKKDVTVALSISFANDGGGSILQYIPGGYVNGEEIQFLDGQVPKGIGAATNVDTYYWNLVTLKLAEIKLTANTDYEIKILANAGNLDAYILDVLPEHVHTEETVAGKAATCTETGLTDGKKCSECGETLVEQEVIPVKGHTEVVDAAVAATCTETGKTEGKHCSVCSEVLVAQETVDALGHKDVDPVDFVCDVCNTDLCTEHQAGEPVKENEVESTCEKAGSYDIIKINIDFLLPF